MLLQIHDAARKHGVADEDIEHAVSHAMTIDDQDDSTRLHLGPARNAEMLEVVTVRRRGDVDLAIHAMPMRRRFKRLLDGERR